MNEMVVSIGTNDALVGVYTAPACETSRDTPGDAPTVILLNAGVVHRSGPFRLHVEVARRLASLGYPCFRFDLAYLGDSAPRSQGLTEQEGAERDVRRVMDFLESRHSCPRFVLFGLCSGADNSHTVALRDNRVTGVIALDGFAYPTFGFYLRRYARFACNPRHVYRSGLAKLHRSIALRATANVPQEIVDDEETEFRIFEREFAARELVEREIESLADRGVQALYAYSGGYTYYNYGGQFFDNFPRLRGSRQIDVAYFPEADHTFLLLEDRRRLIDRANRWMTTRFPRSTQPRMVPASVAV